MKLFFFQHLQYSIAFCCIAVFCVFFIRPPVFQYLIITIAILNMVVSIFMLRIFDKTNRMT